MNETKERSDIEKIRYNQRICCHRYLEDIVEILRENTFFCKCLLWEQSNLLMCPSSLLSRHIAFYFKKGAGMRTFTSFHLYSSLTGLCAHTLSSHYCYYQWSLHKAPKGQRLPLHINHYSSQIFSFLLYHLLCLPHFLFLINTHACYCSPHI